jgi:hypothetical protein
MVGMPILKPEKLNGQTICRPYTKTGDGMLKRLPSSSVFFPPSVYVVYPLEAMVEREAQSIVGMRAMTTSELRARLHAFALVVIDNERKRNAPK